MGNVYIYCPRPSQGALELVRALDCDRLRRFDGMDFWRRRTRVVLDPGDTIIAWGACIPELDGIRVLNGTEKILNKYQEWNALVSAGVPSLTMYPDKQIERDRAHYSKKYGLVPRLHNHQGGTDLLNPPKNPDFWVAKEEFGREFRIHSFNGKSIRAGLKIHRDGFGVVSETEWKPNSNLVHPWVKSFDAGWKVNYDGFQSTNAMRKLAHASVKALKLTFGAVDIGEKTDGSLKVLEVNRAPGIEGGSVATYVRAIRKWIDSPQDKGAEDDGAPFEPVQREADPLVAEELNVQMNDYMRRVRAAYQPRPIRPVGGVDPMFIPADRDLRVEPRPARPPNGGGGVVRIEHANGGNAVRFNGGEWFHMVPGDGGVGGNGRGGNG